MYRACLVLPLAAFVPWMLLARLARNAFTPAIPRPIEPRYPLVPEGVLAREITVVVGTKDSITPTLTQLRHLATALPVGVRLLYTYPRPPWGSKDEVSAHAAALRAALGPALGRRARFVPVDSFSNPFDAWLQAVPLVRTKYTLLMHNDVRARWSTLTSPGPSPALDPHQPWTLARALRRHRSAPSSQQRRPSSQQRLATLRICCR